jgi:hypothetical protein
VRTLIAAAALLAGCYPIVNVDADIGKPGELDTTDTTDTGTPIDTTDTDTDPDTGTDADTATSTDTDTGTLPTNPGNLELFDVYCDASDRVHIEATVVRPGERARIFLQETANSPPNWSENHTLAFDWGAGDLNDLSRVLETAAAPGAHQPDVSTVFWCDGFFDLGYQILTYAVQVLDADDNPLACYLFGQDPDRLVDPLWDRFAEPDFDLDDCTVIANP